MTKYVEWDEPWGQTKYGDEDIYLHIVCQARAKDVIAFQRKREPRYTKDDEALQDFLVVHWGRIVEKRE